MPRSPKKPCRYPGCPELIDHGLYCPIHTKQTNKEYNRYGRGYDSKRRYGRAWKRIRDRYIEEHPFCELCYQKGKLTIAEEVHHIKPLSEGGGSNVENLMALCKSCHSSITRAATNKKKY